MSEQKTGFMADLDLWIRENVIFPISLASGNSSDESLTAAKDAVKRAIRTIFSEIASQS